MGWMKSKRASRNDALIGRSTLRFGIAFAVLCSASAFAQSGENPFAKSDKVVRAKLLSKSTKGRSNVIVRLEGNLSSSYLTALEKLGGVIGRKFPAINSIELEIPTKNLAKLGELDFVERISHDYRVQKYDDFTVGHTFAAQAWTMGQTTSQGSGVNIAVVDSGIQPAMDFKNSDGTSRLLYHVDFSSKSQDQPLELMLKDPCGHGTHVAGIAAGNAMSSTGANARKSYFGIAPKANLVSVRVLERDGSGTVSNVLAGLQWVHDNQQSWNIRVVNLSLGHPVGESFETDPLCQMVGDLWRKGIFVVCAAGNMGRLNDNNKPGDPNEGWGTAYGSIMVPGNSPYVITVGAMKKDLTSPGNRNKDKIATYSSRGPSIFDYVLKPDIVAPGNQVISVGPIGGWLFQNASQNIIPKSAYLHNPLLPVIGGNGYFVLSGTSMAAPTVAGAAALMIERAPWLNPDTIKARMMISADKWEYPAAAGTADGDEEENNTDPFTFGAGFLNIPAAISSNVIAEAPALSPRLVLDEEGNLIFVIEDLIGSTRAIWGTGLTDLRAVWGVRAIWGTGTLGDLRAIWGTYAGQVGSSRAVWGTTGYVEETRAIWGSNGPKCDLSNIALGGEN